MPMFLDTRGHNPISIAICARCGCKFPRDELQFDVNFPGLLCCPEDLDRLDPYRLPARAADVLVFDNPRPDVSVATLGPAFTLYANDILGITTVQLPVPWAPNMPLYAGQSVTPFNENDPDVTLPQNWFLAMNDGVTGDVPPVWPTMAGVLIGYPQFLLSDNALFILFSDAGIPLLSDYGHGTGGTVAFLCLGVYPN